jgi:Outer membrane efflux protein
MARFFLQYCALRPSANRTALAGVREERRLGQKSLLDVLNAKRELVEAEVKLIEARRDLVQASYATLASMGRLKTVALKAAATRLTGGWQTKLPIFVMVSLWARPYGAPFSY